AVRYRFGELRAAPADDLAQAVFKRDLRREAERADFRNIRAPVERVARRRLAVELRLEAWLQLGDEQARELADRDFAAAGKIVNLASRRRGLGNREEPARNVDCVNEIAAFAPRAVHRQRAIFQHALADVPDHLAFQARSV